MSKFVLDLDDSSAEMVEMTSAEVDAFSKNGGLRKEKIEKTGRNQSKSETRKEKSKNKQKQESTQKGKITKPKRQRRKSQPIIHLTQEQRFSKQIKQTDLVKYGHAKFIKIGGRNPVLSYCPKAKEILKSGVTWWICNGQYKDSNWDRIFSDIYEITISDLRIHSNNRTNILKEIYHVKFDNLEILHLYENNIRSVEMLARMKVPQLRDLSLRSNKITSLKCFSKMSLKHLVSFSIADNFILRLDDFFCINTQSLEELCIQWSGSKVISQDMSWMAKLKKNPKPLKVTGFMEKVVVQAHHRIPQRQVDDMLVNKYRKPFLMKRIIM